MFNPYALTHARKHGRQRSRKMVRSAAADVFFNFIFFFPFMILLFYKTEFDSVLYCMLVISKAMPAGAPREILFLVYINPVGVTFRSCATAGRERGCRFTTHWATNSYIYTGNGMSIGCSRATARSRIPRLSRCRLAELLQPARGEATTQSTVF